MIIYFIIVSSTCLSADNRLQVVNLQPIVVKKTGWEPEGSSPRSALVAKLTHNQLPATRFHGLIVDELNKRKHPDGTKKGNSINVSTT